MKDIPTTIPVNINTAKIDETIKKLTELKEKMQDVKTLAGEISSCISELKLEVEI